jgi:hypothetical protein
MGAYCTRDEVYLLGLSAQAFVSRPRPFDAVDATTATIRLKAHGLSSLDSVTFEVTSGGSLPSSISAFTVYTPVVVSTDLFRLAGISSWVSAGSGWGVSVDHGRRLDAHILETAAEIDEHLTAHLPPIKPDPVTGLFPQILIGLNARMAARAAVLSLQIENPAYRAAIDRLMIREAFDKEILAAWKAGKPVQPRPTDQNSVLDNAAIAAATRPPVPWSTGYM